MKQSLISGQPVLILVRGLPGSGKTYIASMLQSNIGQNVVMLDPDATDYDSDEYKEHVKRQLADKVDPKLHPYRFLREQAYQGIRSKSIIIWNQPFTNIEIFNKMTKGLSEYAKKHNTELKILVVEVETDPEVAINRIKERKQQGGHGPSEDTFKRFISDYQSVADQGYDVIRVSGQGDIGKSIERIIAHLN